MIYEWIPEGGGRNFGDMLGSLILPYDLIVELEADDRHLYCLVGSVITDAVLDHAAWLGLTPVFVHCGWNGVPLESARLADARFICVRGPLTRAELARRGVDAAVGADPAYAIPAVFGSRSKGGGALLARHLADPNGGLGQSGADSLVELRVHGARDAARVVSRLACADFVLAGSLHAAMVAHAFGVPFAPFRESPVGFVDHPTKWEDWAAFAAIESLEFAQNIDQGREWHGRAVLGGDAARPPVAAEALKAYVASALEGPALVQASSSGGAAPRWGQTREEKHVQERLRREFKQLQADRDALAAHASRLEEAVAESKRVLELTSEQLADSQAAVVAIEQARDFWHDQALAWERQATEG